MMKENLINKNMRKIKDNIKISKNKVLNKIKKCECTSIITIIIVILIVILFGVNTYVTIFQNLDYQKKVQSGNDRWQQVFNIIEETKTQTNTLNDRVTELEQMLNEMK